MSESVDTRIVEMQFDNEQFEKGIESTLRTLKELDSGLELSGGTSGLQKIKDMADSISFKNATSEVHGFSGVLEDAKGVAAGVFESITDKISGISKAIHLVSMLTKGGILGMAVTGGWGRASKINQAQFKLDSMGIGWKNVADSVKEAVDGTAHSMEAAATSAALFASSGIQTGEAMTRALKATSTLATVSGSSFEEIGDIMAKIAAQGKVTGLQIDSLAFKGIDAASLLKGYLHVTDDEFDKLRKDGIDLNTFIEAVFSKFGEESINANNSFDGALANMRSALNRTLADLFQYGQLGVIPIFNGIRESINALNWALKPLVGTWSEFDEQTGKTVEHYGVIIDFVKGLGEEVGHAFHLFGGSTSARKMIDPLTGSEMNDWVSSGPGRMRRIFQGIADAVKGPMEEIVKGADNFTFACIQIFSSSREILRIIGELLSPIGQAIHDVFGGGTFKEFAHSFRYDFTEPILEQLADLHASEGFINTIRTAFDVLFSLIRTVGTIAIENLGKAFKFVFDVIKTVGLSIGGVFDVISAIVDMSKNGADGFGLIFDVIGEFLKSNNLGFIVDFFKGLGKGISSITKALRGEEGAFDNLSNFLSDASNNAIAFSSEMGDNLVNAGKSIYEFASNVRDHSVTIAMNVMEKFGTLWNTWLGPVISDFGKTIGDVFESFKSGLSNSSVFTRIADFFNTIKNSFSGSAADTKNLRIFSDKLKLIFHEKLQDIAKIAEKIAPKLHEFFDWAGKGLVEGAKKLGEFAGTALDAIAPAIGFLKDKLGELWDSAVNFITTTDFNFDPIKDFFKGIADGIGKIIDVLGGIDFKFPEVPDFIKNITGIFGNDEESKIEDIGTKSDNVRSNVISPLKQLASEMEETSGPLAKSSDNLSKVVENIASITDKFPIFTNKNTSDDPKTMDQVIGLDTDDVVDKGFNFISAFDDIAKFFSDPVGTIKESIENLDFLGKFSESINQFVDGIQWEKVGKTGKEIASLAASGGMIFSLFEVGRFLDSASGLMDSIKDIPKAFGEVVESFKGIGDAVTKSIKTQAVLNIAIAIGVLVGAIVALTFVDLDKAWEALKMVSLLLLEVTAIVVIFGKLAAMEAFDIAGIASFTSGMLGIAVAAGVMGIVVYALGKMDENEMKKGKTALFGFVGMMAVFQVLASKFPADIKGIGTNMIAVAVAIGIMAVVVNALGTIPDDVLGQGIAVLTGIVVMLGILSAIVAYVGSDFKEGAIGLLAIAGVIVVLTAAIKVLGEMDFNQLIQGSVAIGAMILVLGGIIALMTKFPPNVALEGATSLIALAGAIGIIAIALGALAMIGMLGGDLIGAAGALVMLCMGLALVMAVMTQLKSPLNDSADGLLKLAIVLGVLTAALVVLQHLDPPKVAAGLGLLFLAIIELVGAFAAFSAISKFLDTGIGSIVAFVAVVASVMIALELLQYIDTEAVSENLNNLATVLIYFVAALLAVGVVGTLFGAGVNAIAMAFAILAAGISAIVLSVALFVIAITGFINAFKDLANNGDQSVDNIINAIKRFSQGLWDSRNDIANGIAGVMYALVAGIARGLAMALVAVAEFLGQLLGVIVAAIPLIVESAIGMVAGIIDGFTQGIDKYGGEILDAILRLGQMLLDGVLQAISAPINEFNNWLYEVTGGIAGVAPVAKEANEEVARQASEGADSGNTIVEDSNKKWDQYIQSLKDRYGDANASGEGLSESVISGVFSGAKDFNVLEALKLGDKDAGITLDGIKKRAEEMGTTLPDVFNMMTEAGISGGTPIDQILNDSGVVDPEKVKQLASEAGTEIPEGVFEGASEEAANGSFDITPLLTGKETLDKEAVEGEFRDVGKKASKGFVEEFTGNLKVDGTPQVKEAARKMRMEKQFATSAHANAVAAVKAHADSLRPMTSRTSTVMDKVRDEIDSKRRGMHSSGWYIGYNIVDGMIDGLNNQMGSLVSAVEELESLAERALAAKAEIASPSKRFARLGAFMGMGLVKGIESTRDDVWAASEGTADAALDAMSLQTDILSDLVDGIEDQPVIRPILDLSDYNSTLAGMKGLDSSTTMLYAQSSGLGSRMAYEMGPGASNSRTVNVSVNLNYDASADANQIVMDIANGLEARLAMEGV